MKTGRPRLASPADLDRVVSEMIAEHKATGDVTALHDFHILEKLGISARTLERYYDGTADRPLLEEYRKKMEETTGAGANIDNNNNNISSISGTEYKIPTYGDALKKLILYRQLVCVGSMTSDRFNSGWIFLAKQPHYGGFQDVQRTETRGKQDIQITIAGPDGKGI